eukprot:190016_1
MAAVIHDLINNYSFKSYKHLFEYLSRSKWRINRRIIACNMDQKDSFFSTPLLGTAFGMATFSPSTLNELNEDKSSGDVLHLEYVEHGDYTRYDYLEFEKKESTFPFSRTYYNKIYEQTVVDDTGLLYDDQSSFGQFLRQHNIIRDDTSKHWIHFDWYFEPKQSVMEPVATDFFLRYILDDKILNENNGKFVSNRHICKPDSYVGSLIFDNENHFMIQYEVIGPDKHHKISTQYFRIND